MMDLCMDCAPSSECLVHGLVLHDPNLKSYFNLKLYSLSRMQVNIVVTQPAGQS
jgi:hypothetical protein